MIGSAEHLMPRLTGVSNILVTLPDDQEAVKANRLWLAHELLTDGAYEDESGMVRSLFLRAEVGFKAHTYAITPDLRIASLEVTCLPVPCDDNNDLLIEAAKKCEKRLNEFVKEYALTPVKVQPKEMKQ